VNITANWLVRKSNCLATSWWHHQWIRSHDVTVGKQSQEYLTKTHHSQRKPTFGSVCVIRNLCLDSCSLKSAALTNGTDCSGNVLRPAVMTDVRRSVYVLLTTSAWLWSIVTFWHASSRKPRRRPRTLGRPGDVPPLNWHNAKCYVTQHPSIWLHKDLTIRLHPAFIINHSFTRKLTLVRKLKYYANGNVMT